MSTATVKFVNGDTRTLTDERAPLRTFDLFTYLRSLVPAIPNAANRIVAASRLAGLLVGYPVSAVNQPVVDRLDAEPSGANVDLELP